MRTMRDHCSECAADHERPPDLASKYIDASIVNRPALGSHFHWGQHVVRLAKYCHPNCHRTGEYGQLRQGTPKGAGH
jgi:hypothetical protein